MTIWQVCEDDDGRSYFYNYKSEESVWETPTNDEDWLECVDSSSGKKYYHNVSRDISVWNLPIEQESKGWLECIDSETGKLFYYDMATRRSSWTRPKIGNESDTSDDSATAEESEFERKPSPLVSNSSNLYQNRPSEESVSFGGTSDGEFMDYVLKEGGGTTIFGRRNWKRRFLVLKHGEIAWFKSYKDFVDGSAPLKGRWTSLNTYRMEEMIADPLGIRLLPLDNTSEDRIWKIKVESPMKKKQLTESLSLHVGSCGYMKGLDRELSAKRLMEAIAAASIDDNN